MADILAFKKFYQLKKKTVIETEIDLEQAQSSKRFCSVISRTGSEVDTPFGYRKISTVNSDLIRVDICRINQSPL